MVTIDARALDDISAEARNIKFWRTVLTVVAGMLVGVGWVVYQVFSVTWRAATWGFAAVKYGWNLAKQQNDTKPTSR